MKKSILCIFLIFGLCACQMKSKKGIIDVTATNVLSRLSAKETMLVLIDSDDCYSCEMFKQDAEQLFNDKNILVYEINANEATKDELDQLGLALGSYSSYPILFYVQDGEVNNGCKYEYSIHPERYETWLQNMKLIAKH